MRTITIEGLRVLAQIGVLAHEFGAPHVSVEVNVQRSEQGRP